MTMDRPRFSPSSSRVGVALLAIAAVTASLPSLASAQQIRLGGGDGSPVTVEFLQDITMTMKPGASPQLFVLQLGLQLPGVLADTTLGLEYNVAPSPSLFLELQYTPTDPIVTVDGAFAAIGNESSSASSALLLFYNDDTFTNFGEFEPGGSFTFKASEWVWSLAGTVSPWISPGTFTLTPENFYLYNEPTANFLSSSDWVISASEPSAVPEIDPAGMGSVLALLGGGLGLLERRRKRA